jgi:hypothetical protein
MSYAAVPPVGGRIDIGASVGAAYSTVLANVRLAADLASLPFAVLVVAEIVALLLGGGGTLGMMLAGLVRGLGFALLGTIFIVRWHRFVLIGETIGGDLFPPGWGAFMLVAVKIGLSVALGVVILMLVAALPPHFLTVPIAVIGILALAIGSSRLSLAFPAAAIERPITLRAAWDLAAGHFWPLFACILLCYLPFAVVNFGLSAIGGWMGSLGWLVFQIINLAVSFAAVAVVASLLSALYRQLIGEPGQAALRQASG